ncbi:MAG: GGDEF domain-containing protein [Acidobacteriota bacterium]|nr:GGDEF domain-containing protein [Acidobacteriota bacterium]
MDERMDMMFSFPSIELWEAFGAGIYLSFGIIHIDLWLRRRERLGHLWLGAASFAALAVDITGMMQRHPETAATWVVVLNSLGVAAATAAIFEFVSSLGNDPPRRLARTLELSLLLLAPLTVLDSPALLPAMLLGCFILLLWAMWKAFRAARAGDRDLNMVARGLLVLIACLLADLVQEFGAISLPHGLPILGFAVLFLAAARSLHDRFGREEEASRTDPLTGLLNRRGFLESSDGALVRGRRSGLPLSVVLVDLDHFKRVNDTLDHAAGDAALKAVAACLSSRLRGQDIAARWGGEEFILLLPETALAGALHKADALRMAVAALPIHSGRKRITVTLSAGVAEHAPARNLEETIARADHALFRAKQEGRDRVVADTGVGLRTTTRD